MFIMQGSHQKSCSLKDRVAGKVTLPSCNPPTQVVHLQTLEVSEPTWYLEYWAPGMARGTGRRRLHTVLPWQQPDGKQPAGSMWPRAHGYFYRRVCLTAILTMRISIRACGLRGSVRKDWGGNQESIFVKFTRCWRHRIPLALVQTRLTLDSLWTHLVVRFSVILIRWAISSERCEEERETADWRERASHLNSFLGQWIYSHDFECES